ncbi:MAG TPA: DUF2281 domain-containing protein, partial [Flavobacteriales bacterium]|nr:DUF2281 domain-containing protein [Flavobacteriales bacterium]
ADATYIEPITPEIVAKINALPEDLRKEAIAFVDALAARAQSAGSPRKGGIPGLLKGKIWIADDFDAPLDEPLC